MLLIFKRIFFYNLKLHAISTNERRSPIMVYFKGRANDFAQKRKPYTSRHHFKSANKWEIFYLSIFMRVLISLIKIARVCVNIRYFNNRGNILQIGILLIEVN